MPPKTKAGAPSGGDIGDNIVSFTLTPKETQMLAAVVSLLGDVPSVDFEKVAKLCGQKYARNARTACKKLFDKIRMTDNYGDGSDPEGGAETSTKATKAKTKSVKAAPISKGKGKTQISEESDNDEADEAKANAFDVNKVKTKSVNKKGTAKPVAKKGVGKSNAPKKVTAKGRNGKANTKKEPTPDESEEEKANEENAFGEEMMLENPEAEEDETINMDEDNGKLNDSLSQFNSGNSSQPITYLNYTLPNGEGFVYTNQDIVWAEERNISLEDWLLWRNDNHYVFPTFAYDNVPPPTP